MSKTSDLSPPLGYPGGPCHVVQRIHDNVKSPTRREDLTDTVQDGGDLSNSEAHKIYDLHKERGPGTLFSKVLITAHMQYRMDLRGITMPEVRLGLVVFSKYFQRGLELRNQPDVKKPALRKARQDALQWEQDFRNREPVRFMVPKLALTLVFKLDRSKTVTLVTAFWSNQSDPAAPGTCKTKEAMSSRKPIEEWTTQTFTRPPQSQPRPPVLPLPNDHSKSRDQVIPTFEFNTPDHKQQLDQGTATPGGSSVPGEQYGHPFKEDAHQRRTDKIGYTPRKLQWGKQRRTRGKDKIKAKRKYRKNRSKIRQRQKVSRRKIRNNPTFKRNQAKRRQMLKQNPKRFRRRRGSVLTSPEIAFVTGKEFTEMGFIRSISPITGMVNFLIDNSRLGSLPVPAFLASTVLLTDADEEAFFQLVDVEVGDEAFGDLVPGDVYMCARAFNLVVDDEKFHEKCHEMAGGTDLANLPSDDLQEIISNMVNRVTDGGGSAPRFKDDPAPDAGDHLEVDPDDDELYFGEVDVPGKRASRMAMARRVASIHGIKIEGPSEQDPSFPGYPSQYNPSNQHPKLDSEKPGGGSTNGPNPGTHTVNDDGGSSKVIPWDSDANPGNYTQPWSRARGEMQKSRYAARYKCVPEGMKLFDYTRGYKQISNIRRIPIAKAGDVVVVGLEDITDQGLLIRGKPYMSTREMETLFSGEVVIEEKVDGHPMVAIYEGYTFFCESLKVRHSVDYDSCPYSLDGWPDMLVVYEILDEEREPPYSSGSTKWLSRSEKETVCRMVGAPIVPLVFKGKVKPEDVPALANRLSSFGSGDSEGAVIKNLKKGLFGKFVNIEFQKKITDEDTWGGVHPERKGIRNLRKHMAMRVAAKMAEIADQTSRDIHTRSHGIKSRLTRVDKKNAMWTFQVPGSKSNHTVKVQAQRKGNTTNLSKMDVKVSCTCNFWQWQGPEHHAKQGDYLLGKPRGTASTPQIKDPKRHHHACKHVLAVFDQAQNYFLQPRGKTAHELHLDQPSFQRVAHQYIESGVDLVRSIRFEVTTEGPNYINAEAWSGDKLVGFATSIELEADPDKYYWVYLDDMWGPPQEELDDLIKRPAWLALQKFSKGRHIPVYGLYSSYVDKRIRAEGLGVRLYQILAEYLKTKHGGALVSNESYSGKGATSTSALRVWKKLGSQVIYGGGKSLSKLMEPMTPRRPRGWDRHKKRQKGRPDPGWSE